MQRTVVEGTTLHRSVGQVCQISSTLGLDAQITVFCSVTVDLVFEAKPITNRARFVDKICSQVLITPPGDFLSGKKQICDQGQTAFAEHAL